MLGRKRGWQAALFSYVFIRAFLQRKAFGQQPGALKNEAARFVRVATVGLGLLFSQHQI